MNIDSTQIEGFLAICRDMSFSKAASRLYVSQPVLSRRIQKLEDELGLILFIRNKNLVLTKEGEALKDYFLHASNEFEDIMDELKTSAESSNDQIRIGVCEGIDITNNIKAFTDTDEEKRRSMVFYDAQPVERLIDNFKEKKYDIIIILRETAESYVNAGIIKKISIDDIVHAKKCVVFSSHNALADMKKLTIEDFAQQKLLCLSKEHVSKKLLINAELLERYDISPEIEFCPNMESIYMKLQIEDCFALFDDHERIINSTDLRRLDLKETKDISAVSRLGASKNVIDFIHYCQSFNF